MSDVIFHPYNAVVNDIEDIHRWCGSTSFAPDVIVGISRGGVFPAIHLSHKFNKPLEVLKWSTRDFEERDHLKWVDMVVSSTEGRKFLIVEDIVDSGKTMREMFSTIAEYSQHDLKNIKTVSLWFNTSQTEFVNDYYCHPISRNDDKRWIVFPWET